MPRRSNNRTAIAVLLTSIVLALTLGAGGAAVFLSDGGIPASFSATTGSESSAIKQSEAVLNNEALKDLEPMASAPPEQEQELVEPPNELHAVLLIPGVDFFVGEPTADTVRAELDKAVDAALALSMNAVVVQVRVGEHTICNVEGMPTAIEGFDALEYLTKHAKEKGLYVYTTFPVLATERGGVFVPIATIDNSVLDDIALRAMTFAKKYRPTGVLLEEYTLLANGASFTAYQQSGTSMGYESYRHEITRLAFDTAAEAIREGSSGTLAGIYTTPVWANKATNENGSNTTEEYEQLTDGSADTRAWIISKLADFVVVQTHFSTDDKNLPYSKVVGWWGALAKDADLPLYTEHDTTKAIDAWAEEELAQQYLEGKNVPAFRGSIFRSLAALQENPNGSTDNLKRALNKEIDLSYILEKLEITKPSAKITQVTEPAFTLTGASDPDYELTMNGKAVTRNNKGYFNITVELSEGENTFRFQHKEQDVTYAIVLRSELLKEITPVGKSPVTGGMSVNITAMAYEGASVYAMLNDQRIPMLPTKETGDEGDANGSAYIKYMGSFQTSVVEEEQDVGKITVHASYAGATASKEGAAVTLRPKVALSEGQLVRVIAQSAETFPNNTLDDTSVNTYFPICAGAMDYTVSDELTYADGNKNFTYYQLNSGRRVYAKDIEVVQDGNITLDDNEVTSMNISSHGGTTTVRFQTQKQVSYTMRQKNGAITIEFHYTNKVTAGNQVGENPLFSTANWNGSTLTLSLTNAAAFIGYTAEYVDGNLVFKFKNSPGGLSGARVYIDVGHSADSPGADGNLGHWKEYDINLAISQALKNILENEGATVHMLDTASYVALEQRVAKASTFNPHVFVSVHANSFTNPDSTGSEAYYFNNFSKALASRISTEMASALNIIDRGNKKGLYYVTRTQQYPAILAESGFITNYNDYEMLITPDYQYEVAQRIATAIDLYLATAVGSYADNGSDDSIEESDETDVPPTESNQSVDMILASEVDG